MVRGERRRALITRVVVLGAGYAGRVVLRRAREAGLGACGVVRRPDAGAALRAEGLDALVAPVFDEALVREVDAETHVVVALPPDGATDARLASAMPRAGEGVAAITYVSSSNVYGDRRGVIDDATPVADAPSDAGRRRLAAEASWRALGATVLRCPAIYGPDRGLHVRVLSGAHRIPGDGSGHVSRIHVEDLASLVLASGVGHGETFVVGDAEPAPHREVVAFVCNLHGIPMPPSAPLAEVHETLRGDRSLDGSRALRVLSVTLRYPSYREGIAASRASSASPSA